MVKRSYTVARLSAPDWTRAEKLPLMPCAWSPFEPPEAWAQALCVPGTGLLFRLGARESSPRVANTLDDAPVYEDSCLECFLRLGAGAAYLNMEGNAAGALLCGFGETRHDRARVRELGVPCPSLRSTVRSGEWEALFTVPEAAIAALFGVDSLAPGLLIEGNFYKCGDKTPRPHYAAWSPVRTAAPDFHAPEFFGALKLE